ncbi:MAG: hypothetical protein ACI8UP_004304, partial [Porticoccaceae bacterium]
MTNSRRQLLYLSLLFARQRLRVSSVKNFLKSAAHQHKDPQVRLGYIKELDAEP